MTDDIESVCSTSMSADRPDEDHGSLDTHNPGRRVMHSLDETLEHFVRHQLPVSPSPGKTKEVRQCSARVRRWLCSMSGPGDFKIEKLTEWDGWCSWMHSLKLSLRPTTICNHLMDYGRFLRFLQLEIPHASGLSKNQLALLNTWVSNERSALRPKVREHRFRVLEKKTAGLLTGRDISKFIAGAKEAIPQSLEALTSDPRRQANVTNAAGLLAAYILSYTGTRRSCVVGLDTTEVASAAVVPGPNGGSRIIQLGKHKTSPVYGPARVVLSAVEHRWLLDYMKLRRKMLGYKPECRSVFFNTKGHPMEKITSHVRHAYARVIGRAGVTAMALRDAVATISSRGMSPEDQVKRAAHMGQTVKTRDSHYVAFEPASELLKARQVFEKVLQESENGPVVSEVRQPIVCIQRCEVAENLVRAMFNG